MIAPEGYAFVRRIRMNAYVEVCLAAANADGREVILKSFPTDLSQEGSSRAARELDLLQKVLGPGTPVPIELVQEGAQPVLVMDRPVGIPLRGWVRRGPPSWEALLKVAAQLAAILERIHAAHIVHGGIAPGRVLVDPGTLHVELVDFGSARALGSPVDLGTDACAGGLRRKLYLAPEQMRTGGWEVDFRADLYSLGATLYYAWTGTAPFASVAEAAHAQARPAAPDARRPGLPPALARIVMKLLEPDPDLRYQRATTLSADLMRCLEQVERVGSIDPAMPVGGSDAPERLGFPARVYGRDEELAALSAMLERVRVESRCAASAIRGAPGMGKTALLQALQEQACAERVRFIRGKFDFYRQTLPYSAWVEAFRSLVPMLLGETRAGRRRFREETRRELGPIAGVMVELVPELGAILGDVEPVPVLGPAETQTRLGVAVARFVRACATLEHPLVVILDDLQWADPGSRTLVGDVLYACRDRPLLLLVAFRNDDATGATHVVQLLETAAAGEAAVNLIELGPLSSEACNAFLSDTLRRPLEHTRRLAETVALKTGNNPLLIRQFLSHMRERGLILYEVPAGWVWDNVGIAGADVPDDVAGLMVTKLEGLSAAERQVLECAACVGDSFDIDGLRILTQRSRASLQATLYLLCEEGLIAPCREGFRFVHDRIREAARDLRSPEERAILHQRMARLLLESTPEELLPERIFDVVDHLIRARDLVSDTQRLRWVELARMAGTRALATGAPGTALRYLEFARGLMQGSDWASHPELCFEVLLAAARSAYQIGEFDTALERLDELEPRARTRHQLALVAVQRLTAVIESRPLDESLRASIQCVRRFGLRWSLHPSWLRVRFEILRTDRALRGSLEERPLAEPTAGDLDAIAPFRVAIAACAAAAFSDMRFSVRTVSAALRAGPRHGYVDPASMLGAYACLRGLLMGGDFRRVRRLRDAAAAWRRRATRGSWDRADLMLPAYVDPWLAPRRSTLGPLTQAARSATEAGDITHAGLAIQAQLQQLPFIGEPLSNVIARYETAEYRSIPNYRTCADQVRSMLTLLVVGADPDALESEWSEIDRAVAADADSDLTFHRVVWVAVCCMLGRYARADEHSRRLESRIFRGLTLGSFITDFCLYRGIATAALAEEKAGRWRRRRTLRDSLRRLRAFARTGPDFVHMATFLEAELAQLRSPARALDVYARAVREARDAGHVHNAALAEERRARLLLRLGRRDEAAQALEQARDLYAAWGAACKANGLACELANTRAS